MTVGLVLDVLLLLMFLRAIVSWFPDISGSRFADFLFTVTEWVIMPFRNLFDAMNWKPMLPIDIPYFVAFVVLSIVRNIL